MALFEGEDMVDVTTPDGRTLTLPRSLVPASMMPQQQSITAAVPGLPMGAPPPQQPTEFAQPVLPPPADEDPTQPGVVEMGEPETTPVTVMPDMEVKARPAVMKKMRREEAARAASPQGKLDSVQDQQNAAASSEAEAVVGMADVQAAEDAVLADAVTERNEQLDGLYANRQAEAQANLEAEDRKMNEVVALRKKLAGTKIDRTLDNSVMGAIGVALGVIAAGIKGTDGGNPALDMLFKALDRKVDGQMADLDQMGKVYGYTKEEVAMLKDKSKSRLEFHNAMIAGETEKAIRHVEEITARSASDKTKANAKMLIAQLQARVADKTMEATRWGLDFDQKDKHHKAQIGVQYAGIKETKRHNMAGEQFDREKLYADQQAALAADRARGDSEMFKARMEAMKEVREVGVRDVNGELYMTPEGKAKMEQAAKWEAEAAQLEEQYKDDPMGAAIKAKRVAQLRQAASQTRGDAGSFNVVKGKNTTDSIEISNKLSSGQSVVSLIDEIKTLFDAEGRALFSRTEMQSKIRAKFGLLKPGLKEAWQLGAWDKGAANLVNEIIGADPTSDWDVGVLGTVMAQKMYEDPKAFMKGLDAVAEDLERKMANKLINTGVKFGKGETAFQRVQPRASAPEVNTILKGRTPLEDEAAAVPGTAGKIRDQAYSAGGLVGEPQYKKNARDAANSGSLKYVGLSPGQAEGFDKLLVSYKSGNTRDGDLLIETVREAAVKHPETAVAMVRNLEEHSPKLYRAARATLPKDSAAEKQLSFDANAKISRAPVPAYELGTMVVSTLGKDGRVTNDRDYAEIARRAGREGTPGELPGDKGAKRALADIVSASSKIKSNASLPQNSVFKGGR